VWILRRPYWNRDKGRTGGKTPEKESCVLDQFQRLEPLLTRVKKRVKPPRMKKMEKKVVAVKADKPEKVVSKSRSSVVRRDKWRKRRELKVLKAAPMLGQDMERLFDEEVREVGVEGGQIGGETEFATRLYSAAEERRESEFHSLRARRLGNSMAEGMSRRRDAGLQIRPIPQPTRFLPVSSTWEDRRAREESEGGSRLHMDNRGSGPQRRTGLCEHCRGPLQGHRDSACPGTRNRPSSSGQKVADRFAIPEFKPRK